ncbi:MAG: XRE family transcriptional regulator [Flavobacteriaceae bacterium]|nr:XRE family transcriptional regulator [Flavobacteriaceae bacterium]
MNAITHKDYKKANLRLEELLKQVRDDMSENSAFSKELIQVSHIVEQYEKKHDPIESPTLKEVMELRMSEMNLSQKDLAQ